MASTTRKHNEFPFPACSRLYQLGRRVARTRTQDGPRSGELEHPHAVRLDVFFLSSDPPACAPGKRRGQEGLRDLETNTEKELVDEIASMGVDVGTGIPTRGAACAWDDEIAPFVGARERIPSRTSSSRFAARAGDNW